MFTALFTALIATMAMVGIAIPVYTVGGDGTALQTIVLNPWESLADHPTPEQLKAALVFLIKKYGNNGGDYAILWRVLQCESSLDNAKVGKAGEIGIAQFMPATWRYFSTQRGITADIHSLKHQLDMFSWAMSNHLQHHWTCWKKLKQLH